MLKIDECELELTAKLLAAISPGNTARGIRNIIECTIKPGENTVVSAGGWVASTYIDPEGNTGVRVSLSAYAVAHFMNGGVSPYTEGAKYFI